MDETLTRRGGRRPGAGRRKRDTVQITVRISREAAEHLRQSCEEAHVAPGKAVETLILAFKREAAVRRARESD